MPWNGNIFVWELSPHFEKQNETLTQNNQIGIWAVAESIKMFRSIFE
jgi:hypothetical protein